MNIIYGTNNRPNENLQKVLDTRGVSSNGPNWHTVGPNTIGQTGSLNVPFLNEYANRKTTPNAVQTPPNPSSANTPMSALNVPVDPYQSEYDRYGQMYKSDADQVVDQDKIYRNQLKMYQAEIDAVNQIYSNQLASARQEGLGRLGSTTAASARSGTLGSDFGFAQQNEMTGYNRGIEQGIQAQQAAKVGEIMGLVRKGTADEIAAKTAAKTAGAQNYLEYLRGASERRTTRTAALVDQLLTSETDPNTVDWDTTLKGSNLNKDEIMTAYTKAKKEQEARQAEAQAKADMEERKMALDERKADIDQAYNEGRLTNEQRNMELDDAVAWYNASTSRINAETGMANSSKSSTSAPFSNQQIADAQAAMASRTGTDGFTDSMFYMESLDEWRRAGGSVDSFLKQFPVTKYVNPKDPTVNTMLKSVITDEKKTDPLADLLARSSTQTTIPTGRNLTTE